MESQILKLSPPTLSLCKISSEMIILESIDKMCETLIGYRRFYDFGSKSVSGLVEDVTKFQETLKQVFFLQYFKIEFWKKIYRKEMK